MGVMGSVMERYDQLMSSDEVYRLIAKTGEGHPSTVRVDAIGGLGGSCDPRAVRPLMECCNDENPDIRRSATDALCRLKSPRAVGTLIGRMCDRNELMETRKLAASGLAAVKGFAATEGLKAIVLDEGEDPDFRNFVHGLFNRIEKK